MKSSFSQASTFKNCPMYFKNNYVDRLEPIQSGASTYFGSAIDSAVSAMLEGKGETEYLELFRLRWDTAVSFGKATKIWDNPNITYSYNDFDEDILTSEDLKKLQVWCEELSLFNLGSNPIEIYKETCKIKKNPYKKLKETENKYFNRISWLCLYRKGELLIKAFKEQFYPKIKRVLATQKQFTIKDDYTGDSIVGVIDMIVELEGFDKPLILDLKTAASEYEQSQLDFSDQLSLYVGMAGQEFNTNLVGYVVLSKRINKEVEAICTKCGHTKDSRHQTCNNEAGGSRCGGTWDEKIKIAPQVQFLSGQKSLTQVESVLSDMSSIILAQKNGIFYKNTDKCDNYYGAPCPYKKRCWQGSNEGLKPKGT